MKKLTMKHDKVSKKVATPVGRLLWMNLVNPTPSNAIMQPDKYTCTVAWDPKDKQQSGAIAALHDAIIEVARQAYGDNTITLQDLKDNNCLSVIKDGSKMQDYLQGYLVTGASTGIKLPPKVYGPVMAQGEMSKEDVARIKNGDYGRMVVTISSYKTPAKHGITAYLSLVQFAKTGEYLGGKSDGISLLGDLEVGAVTEDEKALIATLPVTTEEPVVEKTVLITQSGTAPEVEKPVLYDTAPKEPDVVQAPVQAPEDNSFEDLFNF